MIDPEPEAVLDVGMGGDSGLEVARKLRSVPTPPHVPVVILTGLDEREVRRQFTAYDLFVSKGEDLNEFVGS